jgi:predicted TIM-barrel fold metal-dependent hydrolase
MIIDVHCHYTLTARRAAAQPRFSFEPADDADGPAFDSCVAPRAVRRLSFALMKRILRIDSGAQPGDDLDAVLHDVYAKHLLAPGAIDRFVLLAFDRYHDDDGRQPPMAHRRGDLASDMYTSNSLVRALCRRHPDRFLFGASIHPYRRNAPELVNEVFEAGACLLKWIPLHQNIDIADPRTLEVLRRCAGLGLPLLLHYSEEFTLTTQHRCYRPATALLDVLRRLRRRDEMPPVIIAHVATPVTPAGEMTSHEAVVAALLGEFATAPLYADVSALTSWGKVRFLRQLARRQELHAKLLFGSDFPVPLALFRLRRDLGREFRKVAADPSWPNQALRVFRHTGFNEIVFRRAAQILPHTSFFA